MSPERIRELREMAVRAGLYKPAHLRRALLECLDALESKNAALGQRVSDIFDAARATDIKSPIR